MATSSLGEESALFVPVLDIVVVFPPKVLLPLPLFLAPLANDEIESARVDLGVLISNSDHSCVCQALSLRASIPDSRVTVIACGPEEVDSHLLQFAVRGVDGILRATLPALDLRNPTSMLATLLLVLQHVHFDLILMGQAISPEPDPSLRGQGRAIAERLQVPYYEVDEILQVDASKSTFMASGEVLGKLPSVVSLKPQAVPSVSLKEIIRARHHSARVQVKSFGGSSRTPVFDGSNPVEPWPPGSLGALYPRSGPWHPEMRWHYRPLLADAPLLPQIRRAEFELDQRLEAVLGFACQQAALSDHDMVEPDTAESDMILQGLFGPGPPVYGSNKFKGIRDSFILPFIINAEPLLRHGFDKAVQRSGLIQHNPVTFEREFEFLGRGPSMFEGWRADWNAKVGGATARVFSHALMRASLRGDRSLRYEDVLGAALHLSLALGEAPYDRPMLADWILDRVFGRVSLRAGADRLLSESPEVQALLASLLGDSTPLEGDFQFFLGLGGGKPEIRVCTILEDFWQQATNGSLHPLRAILFQYADRYWHFEQTQIDELSDLIQSPATKEADLQKFLERNPHFLRTFDHREVYPHVVLQTDDGKLIPDFIVTNAAVQEAMIVELKLPKARVVVHDDRATRFSMAVFSARAQLLRYRRWLDQPVNRKQFEGLLGMKDYRLRIGVVIGRSGEFRSPRERLELDEDHPDIQVLTYDDLIQHAKQEQMRSKAFWKR